MALHCTQEFVVRWENVSVPCNGVRQGGNSSPCIYMNKLSSTLNDAKVGCIMNGVYMNHLMYADDLVLIAPSVRALQVLLRYCDSSVQINDVKYNAKKTVCMFFSTKELGSEFVPCFELSGLKLKCGPTQKYLGPLGVHIATDRKDDRSIR